MAASNNNFSLRSVLEKDKLNTTNFIVWSRNLRIVLKQENKSYVLDAPMPNEPARNATEVQRETYATRKKDSNDVACLMLLSMVSDLQEMFENQDAYTIMKNLKEMFQQQARHERFVTSKALTTCRMTPGTPVSTHVLKMKGYLDTLDKLDVKVPKELATDLILGSLPNEFDPFVLNFNMNAMDKTVTELHGMLKNAEENIRKTNPVLMVQGGIKKPKGKGKAKAKPKDAKSSGSKPKAQTKPKAPKLKESESTCFHCNKLGHWKKNCALFKEEQKKNGAKASSSGIFVIEINLSISTTWVLDTGCGSHICSNVQGLRNRRLLGKSEVDLRVGNGARVAAIEIGNYQITLPSGLSFDLVDCYFVPAMSRNIISVSRLDMDGFDFVINNGIIHIRRQGILYGTAMLQNGLYILDLNNQESVYNINTKRVKTNELNPTYFWHCRLGHANEKRISRLHKAGVLGSFDLESYDTCEPCLHGKMTKSPFNKKGERTSDLLSLIHTDVCGPLSTQARGGFNYFVTFTDDFSRYGYVYLMKHKSETFDRFKEFKNEVENQLGKSIKAIRSDRGGEYLSQEFDNYLKECGIISQLTPPGTPQWNGVSERRNRTLLDMVRSMMSQADLPISFWGYALETAAFLLNRTPTKTVEKTPYEVWTGTEPNLSFLKIWGCVAHVKKLTSDKLESKSAVCLFVGYPKETKGYYFYSKAENKVFVARKAVFLEKEFLLKKNSGSKIELGESQVPQTPVEYELEMGSSSQQNVEQETITQEPRRSSRVRREIERYGFLITDSDTIELVDREDPTTYQEAIESPDSDHWREAMNSEMQSMYDNKVWALVDPPEGAKVIECKWLFKLKADKTYKGRLVAKGFRQTHGVDYDETFSPVVMLKSIRILLAIAAFHDYEVWQMDVKTAFLNGNLLEDVYMTQPEGFVDPKHPKKVCKLQRSIYGLKQASRSWNLRFDEVVKEFDFIKNEDEPCVYKKVSGSIVVFLVLYVDDILLIGNDIPTLQNVKQWLGKCFSMKDLGEAETILGIRIYRDRSRRLLGLSQDKYIDKVLRRFSMGDSKKGYIPLALGVPLTKDQCPKTQEDRDIMSRIPYASAIGSIMYAMLCTRLDVAHALSVTSRFQQDPGVKHWSAVKGILKYLRRTKDHFLVYGGQEELVIQGYADAAFQTSTQDSRSQSGFVFVMNGAAVSWKSSKQETVADSTTESEYIAASEAAKEAVWIRNFISGLGVVPSILDPLEIFCDNNGAIAQAKEPRSHQKSKHILRRYHLIREIIERGDVKISKIASEDNIADPLTKQLRPNKHEAHLRSFGLRVMPDWD